MVQDLISPVRRLAAAGAFVAGQALVGVVALAAALAAVPPSEALAQRSPIHYFNRGGLPPGAIGSQQLLRGGPLPGYFQPVEVEAPEGASISLAVDGQFRQPRQGKIKAGMLLGQVYYFRVTGIRRQEGFEVYPTVEVINRLYPPPGQEARFPIPIQLADEELALAIEGQFVTRIIYLENPNGALPVAQDLKRQRYFEIHPNDDPLEVADRLGRPMAILRMGSRVPDSSDSSISLGDRGAPMLLFPPSPEPLPEGKAVKDPAEPAKPAPPKPADADEEALKSAAGRPIARTARGPFKPRPKESTSAGDKR